MGRELGEWGGGVVRRMGHWQTEKDKRQDRKSIASRQKNRGGDRKVESNENPDIPDRRETSDIPCLPSGEYIR